MQKKIYLDIAILADALEDLHKQSSIPLVLTVWKWSFYTCDENNPEDEISL
jgi:hypothetical protein